MAKRAKRHRGPRRPGGPNPQRVEVSGERNVVVQILGDGNTVVAGYAYLTLTRYVGQRVLPGQGESLGDAAALLSPYAFSVPLVGREKVLADLWSWMRNEKPISIRVMTAGAGTGKTRLALELCDQAVREGWDAGFLTPGELDRFRAAQNSSTCKWLRPTLVVVDLAASWVRPLRDWLIELADPAGQNGRPFRLLLLERHADPSGGWWREAFGVGGGDAESIARLLDPAIGPVVLPPLIGPEARRDVLVEILKRVGSTVRPPELGVSPQYEKRLGEITWGGEPLFLLMAGLVAAQADFGEVLALTATDLAFLIAGHEIDRILKIARAREIPEDLLAHLAAYVTLCQGLGQAEVEGLVEEEERALGCRSAGGPLAVYKALFAALPGEQGAVAPILPDIVGEAVILEALGAKMAEKALAAISRGIRQAAPRIQASLIHLAQDYGAVRQEPLRWFERLADESAVDLTSLVALVDQLPESTLALRKIAVVLTERAVVLARAQGSRETLSGLLNALSNRLSDLGNREAALTAIEEAVELYRPLAAARPSLFRPYLANSLSNLSNRQSDLEMQETALSTSKEAVKVYCELAASRPDLFLPGLAGVLNNLALRLRDLGREAEQSLAVIEDAVLIRRELTESYPEVFQPDLAVSLDNLGLILLDLGRLEEAILAVEESVKLLRQLAAVQPDTFRTDLARSLGNLSLCLRALGSHNAAFGTIEEAVRTLAPHFFSYPTAFTPWMRKMLSDYARAAQEAGVEPDLELLVPIQSLLGPDSPQDSAS